MNLYNFNKKILEAKQECAITNLPPTVVSLFRGSRLSSMANAFYTAEFRSVKDLKPMAGLEAPFVDFYRTVDEGQKWFTVNPEHLQFQNSLKTAGSLSAVINMDTVESAIFDVRREVVSKDMERHVWQQELKRRGRSGGMASIVIYKPQRNSKLIPALEPLRDMFEQRVPFLIKCAKQGYYNVYPLGKWSEIHEPIHKVRLSLSQVKYVFEDNLRGVYGGRPDELELQNLYSDRFQYLIQRGIIQEDDEVDPLASALIKAKNWESFYADEPAEEPSDSEEPAGPGKSEDVRIERNGLQVVYTNPSVSGEELDKRIHRYGDTLKGRFFRVITDRVKLSGIPIVTLEMEVMAGQVLKVKEIRKWERSQEFLDSGDVICTYSAVRIKQVPVSDDEDWNWPIEAITSLLPGKFEEECLNKSRYDPDTKAYKWHEDYDFWLSGAKEVGVDPEYSPEAEMSDERDFHKQFSEEQKKTKARKTLHEQVQEEVVEEGTSESGFDLGFLYITKKQEILKRTSEG